jgi:hypothetical protein
MRAAGRALIVVCAVAGACAVSAGVAQYRTGADLSVSAVRRVEAPVHPVSYAGVGATVSAPPSDAKPVFTQSDVIGMISGDSFQQAVSRGSRPSTISLVMYENAFGRTHPGKPDTPSVPKQLAWLVTSKGTTIGGSAGGSVHATTVPLPRVPCTFYVAVSAISGRDLDGFSMCD